jgi:hypothetical protein
MLVAESCHYIGFYGTPKVMLLDGVFALTSPIDGYTEVIPKPRSRKESKQTVTALGQLTAVSTEN